MVCRNDATGGWTVESMKAAVEYSWPSFAHEVISTERWQQQVYAMLLNRLRSIAIAQWHNAIYTLSLSPLQLPFIYRK